jgi:hypothetical protein
MIIRTAGAQRLFIRQPDHAQLSRRVMESCQPLAANPRRPRILRAIAGHYNGCIEPDAAPMVDPASGAPFDFVTAPAAVRHAVWPRGVAGLAGDPWAAALVAQHAVAVYDRFHGDPAWAPFFRRMEHLRDEMVRASGESPADLAVDYPFVRLGDMISLVFCTGWPDQLRFGVWSVIGSGAHVTVSPDPFDGAAIRLDVEARVLRQGPYGSDDELRAEFAQAPVIVLEGTVSGGGGPSAPTFAAT